MDDVTKVAVLITCYNRKDTTLACLDALCKQNRIDDVQVQPFLVDDGCTDGTGEAVRSRFPHVRVLEGDGNLFWCGGMRCAYFEAVKEDFDFHLWLNDDTILFPNFLRTAIDTYDKLRREHNCDAIIVGSTVDTETGTHNYGGMLRGSWWRPLSFTLVEPGGEPRPCNTFNGNCTLIPKRIFEAVGSLSLEYEKMMHADFDYGLRAESLGFPCWTAPGYAGRCRSNSHKGTVYDSAVPVATRLTMMRDARCLPATRDRRFFERRHAGVVWPLYWLRTSMRVRFPRLWLWIRSRPHA